ncbi:MAG: iron transporter [Ruminiclostridium sp.]|nr:iron transporter [Ruminiclostridium sp.]
MKTTRKAALIATLSVAALALAGCGNNTSATTTTAAPAANNTTTAVAATAADNTTTAAAAEAEVKTEAAAAAEDAGFTEIPIFEDEEVGFLNVSAVYFQPVPMSGGNGNTEDFNIHLEADISALENTVGFGVGDWVPYLTVDYDVTASDGSTAASGTFMEMSASDGPHYGANVKLPNADTYSIKFTIHSPEENGYLLHTDAETGPGGSFDDYFGNGNLIVEYNGWDYVPQEW